MDNKIISNHLQPPYILDMLFSVSCYSATISPLTWPTAANEKAHLTISGFDTLCPHKQTNPDQPIRIEESSSTSLVHFLECKSKLQNCAALWLRIVQVEMKHGTIMPLSQEVSPLIHFYLTNLLYSFEEDQTRFMCSFTPDYSIIETSSRSSLFPFYLSYHRYDSTTQSNVITGINKHLRALQSQWRWANNVFLVDTQPRDCW